MEKRKMSRILDGLGLPANQQPQGQQINPVLAFFLPQFQSAINLRIQNGTCGDGKTVVDFAFEVATEYFRKLGFEYMAPMGCRPFKPEEPADEESPIQTP
jgi:hypothetical protein